MHWMQYIPVNTFGLILIIIRKTPRRRVPVSLCDGYCQRLTKKNRDLHTGPVVMSCAAPFFNSLPIFHHYRKHLCSRKGLNYMPRKQRSCTIACQICMVFYGFLSCSSFCICVYIDMTCLFDLSCQRPEAAPSLVSCAATQLGAVSSSQHELAARARKILRALRAFGWVRSAASNTVSFRQPWKMMEKKQEHPNTLTHTHRH